MPVESPVVIIRSFAVLALLVLVEESTRVVSHVTMMSIVSVSVSMSVSMHVQTINA